MNPRFIHLRIHSDYSMIDGLAKINSLIKKAVTLRMPSLAITDFTNLCGLIKFYNEAHNAGIKPIIGADFFLKTEMLNKNSTELTILAINNIGYKNLTLLISDAYKHGYGSSGPVIHRNWLINYNEGLILLSGGRKGDIGQCLLQGNKKQLDQYLTFYKRYFSNRFYLELTRTGRIDEEIYLHAAVELAIDKNLPVVATNDVRFIDPEDFDAHQIRVAIHGGFTLNDDKKPHNYSYQQYMRCEEEMCKLFADLPEALTNTVEIARRCNVNILLGEYFLPQFPTGKISIENCLIKYAKKGLEHRLKFLFTNIDMLLKRRHIYDDRLAVELQVINKMGFPGYFLIVMEFIQWAKDNNIPVGPGRGSGAGSLVAYALKITDLDPLAFDLIFERFLNPERISMPDFDIDFCMDKRDLVIDHMSEIYGRESVSQIITFGTMTAKAAIRDVGRVLGYPYKFVNRISKLIPIDPGITLEKALIMEPQLQNIYNVDEEVKILINMARKLEGVTRNASKHAGGIVIAPTKITDFTPLYCDAEGNCPVTQFDKNDIEQVGLVKFDFLGLRTLTIINKTLEIINNRRLRKNLDYIKISTISLEDKKSFDMLQRSETTAVFQLESLGMKDLIKRLQPDCFEDIIALLALFRPGPLKSGMVDNFINRKHGRENIYYPDVEWQHPLLKPILESTYGIILYQEQVMQIAQVLAGYTLGSADILRRAMAKKKLEEMIKQRSIFKAGAKNIGIDSQLSMKIFDLLEKFAGYGFNKSHSTAYALISYQTLWLKANYPAEFMAAAMTSDMDNTERIVCLIDECLRIGLKILPPDINHGQYHFHINKKGEIVYGIGAIKGIGKGAIESIIESRNQDGNFHNLFDLCARVNIKKLNRRMLEKMIMSGALDGLGSHRAVLINTLDSALKFADQHTKNKIIGQYDMFNIQTKDQRLIESSYSKVDPWTEQEVLDGERETLGLYLTGHPITQYLQEIEYYSGGMRLKDICSTKHSKIITVVGLVVSIRIHVNKTGNKIGICILDDRSGRLDVIFFTDILEKYKHLIKKDCILFVSGQVNLDHFNGKLKMIAREVMDINEVREKYVTKLAIFLHNKQINEQLLNQLRLALEQHRPGKIPVNLYYQIEDVIMRLPFGKNWQIKLTDNLLNNLKKLLGNQQVELEFD